MPTVFELPDDAVIEGSTCGIGVAFKDENGDAVVPNSATWTLTDIDGVVINSREDVVISSLAASITIALSGDDLAFSQGFVGHHQWRILTVEAVYNSVLLGTNLPLKEFCKFPIINADAI